MPPSDGACSGAPTRRACATRPIRLAKPPRTFRIALVGDSIGAGWGVNVEQRFESILEEPGTAEPKDERSDGRDHQLRRSGAFPGPALVPFQPGRLADGSGPGDLRVDRGRRRLGRTAAALPAGAGSAGIAPFTNRC